MSRNLKNIRTQPDSYEMGTYPGQHELVLYGRAAEPVVLRNRGTETHLSADDIRKHVLLFVAEHPDEFGPVIRAIVKAWDGADLDHLNQGIHAFNLPDRERSAFRQAITESESHAS